VIEFIIDEMNVIIKEGQGALQKILVMAWN
jgi:hypothetical protein